MYINGWTLLVGKKTRVKFVLYKTLLSKPHRAKVSTVEENTLKQM